MRLLGKNIIVNRLSLFPTISCFEKTFCIICIDDSKSMPILKKVKAFKHASFIKPLGLNFSDAYICFLQKDEFFNQLKLVHSHLITSLSDGTNMMLAFSYKGQFFNIYNKYLFTAIVSNQYNIMDIDNLFVQAVCSLILLVHNIFFSLIDMFLLSIEKKNFYIF
jgi:hypothetical protein